MIDFLNNTSFYNNTLLAWLTAVGWIILSFFAGQVLYWLFERLTKPAVERTETELDDLLLDRLKGPLITFVVLFGIRQGLGILDLSPNITEFIARSFLVFVVLIIGWLILRIYEALYEEYAQSILFVLINRAFLLVALLATAIFLILYWVPQPKDCAPDCTGVNLIGSNLSDIDLRHVNFVRAGLRGVDLAGVDLTGADLSGADLVDANLKGANLTEAKLIGANLTQADLRGVILDDTDLRGANLSKVDLTGTNVTKARLNGATLSEAKLIEANLSNANLAGNILIFSQLIDANLSGANLSGVYMSGTDLSGATLTDANLIGSLINRANLIGADLSGANLSGVSFIGTDLASTSLINTELVGANLVGTNFKGANLKGTDLTGAKLFKSDLTASDLIEPVLAELNSLQLSLIITDADFNGIITNRKTQWPQDNLPLLADLLGYQLTDLISADIGITVLNIPPSALPTTDETIIISGNSALVPLIQAVEERLNEEGFNNPFILDPIGSTLGFKILCETSNVGIVMSDRPIRANEIENCQTQGRQPVELQIVMNALVVNVNPQNNFINNVTPQQLGTILSANRWANVDASWSDESIIRFLPDAQSNAFATIAETLFPDDPEALLNAPTTLFSSNEHQLIQSISIETNGIGLFSYSHYLQNKDKVKLVTIDQLEPTATTVNSGDYLFSQPLFLYTNVQTLQESPPVALFLDFLLATVNDFVQEVGYFPLPQDVYETTQRNLLTILPNGSLFIDELALNSESEINEEASTDAQPEPDQNNTDLWPEGWLPNNQQGGESEIDESDTQSEVSQGNINEILITGDPALASPTLAIYSRFIQDGYTPTVKLDNLTPSPSLADFCATDEADIVMVHRPITADEVESCAESDRQLIELPVGLDTLIFTVNPTNTFLIELTPIELTTILTAITWSEVNPAWPNEPIQRFIPDHVPDTLDLLAENLATAHISFTLPITNTTYISDSVQLIQQVMADPNALSLLDYATYLQNAEQLRLVTLTGTISSTTSQLLTDTLPLTDTTNYTKNPFAQPFFLYVDAQTLQDKPVVKTFLDFYLTYINEVIESSGYLPIQQNLLDEASNRLMIEK